MEIAKSEKTYDPCESKDESCLLEQILITIDGKNYIANKSQTIVEIAKLNGIIIPTLCYHPDLKLGGICRICVVSVDGKLETSCSYKIDKPVNIVTHNEEIRQVRRNLLELILSNHVGECTVVLGIIIVNFKLSLLNMELLSFLSKEKILLQK